MIKKSLNPKNFKKVYEKQQKYRSVERDILCKAFPKLASCQKINQPSELTHRKLKIERLK